MKGTRDFKILNQHGGTNLDPPKLFSPIKLTESPNVSILFFYSYFDIH